MADAKLFRMLLVCLLTLGLSSASVSSQRKKQIAVLDFDFATRDLGIASHTYGGQQNLGRQISDKLMTGLFGLGSCHVIERSQLERVLREQNLGLAGRIDESTAAKVGRILGVDGLVIGNVSVLELLDGPKNSQDTSWNPKNLKARIAVNVRLVNTTTGRVEFINEFTGISAPPKQQKSGKNDAVGALIGGILGGSKSNQMVRVKDEQIRDVVYLAVDSVVTRITADLDKYFSGPRPEATVAPTPAELINGRVISVTGPSVVITGVNKAAAHIGDRLYVRRGRVIRDPVTNKEIRFSDKVGEVEIVEIQDEVIIGSFSGSAPAQVGDTITNGATSDGLAQSIPKKDLQTSPSKDCPTCKTLTPRPSLPNPDPGPIERYPIIDCPDTVFVAREFAVQVFLSLVRQQPLAKVRSDNSTSDGGISLPLPPQPNQAPWKIEVVLSAPDFELPDGQNTGTIELYPSKDSSIVKFRLKPKPVQQSLVTTEISATLWHEGNFLGQISRAIAVSRPDKTGRAAPPLSRPSDRQGDAFPSMSMRTRALLQSRIKNPSKRSHQSSQMTSHPNLRLS